MTRKCTVCGETKRLSDFKVGGPELTQELCRSCHRKGWFPPEYLKALPGKRKPVLEPGACFRWPLGTHQRRLLKVACQARCSICGREGRLHADHDHTTNIIRGMLCSHCNQGLGMFRDNPATMRAALKYLLDPPTPRQPIPPGMTRLVPIEAQTIMEKVSAALLGTTPPK